MAENLSTSLTLSCRVNVLVSEGRLEEAEDLVKEHLLDPGVSCGK